MSAKRLFAAIELPDTLKESLVRLEPEIRGARWVPAEQMHLTLGFFGDVDPIIEEKLRDKLGAIRWSAFFLPLIGLGTFPRKGGRKSSGSVLAPAIRISFSCTSACRTRPSQ